MDDMDKLIEYGQRDVTFLTAHDLIYIKYRIKIQRRKNRIVTFRDWSGFDGDAFRSDVEGINWTDFYDIM